MHHFYQRGAPMHALQSRALLSSETSAMDQLQDFLRQRRAVREPVQDFDAFEQEWHRLFVAVEREALGHELARFDLSMCQRPSPTGSATIASCGVQRPTTVRQ